MKNLFVGAVLGAAAVYLMQRNKQDGGLDKMCDEMKEYAYKVKNNAKEAWDKGVNKAECMKDRAEDKMDTVKKKVDEAMQ